MKYSKLCVLGLGYIGLPTASTFASHGLEVLGVDVNPVVVNTLKSGGLHIHEPGLRTLVQAALGSGNLRISEQAEPADAFIIAVPTPFFEDKRADLRAVQSAAEAITPHLRNGNLVILESTSPPRTTVDMLAPILERSGLKAGKDFHLAYSPERVLPGKIIHELIENARVIGGIDQASAEAGRDLYQIFVKGEIVLTDATTAEMVKLMENTYRDVNIAIANEYSRLAERFGIDIWEAIPIANRHPRVEILQPGPGVGGHCIGVDPWFLVEAAPDLTSLIYTARQVNDTQPKYIVDQLHKAFQIYSNNPTLSLRGRQIAAFGLAYKPDIDDLRESPAIDVVKRLQAAGAVVTAYEPYKTNVQLPGVRTTQDLDSTLRNAEAILLLVRHSKLIELDPGEVRKLTQTRLVFDTVNGWPAQAWRAAGFHIYKLGVGFPPVIVEPNPITS